VSHTKDEPESGGVMSRVRMPIIFLLGLGLFLGAYYFLYAQKKTSYLVGRNHRILATMGKLVRESILGHGQYLRNQAGDRGTSQAGDGGKGQAGDGGKSQTSDGGKSQAGGGGRSRAGGGSRELIEECPMNDAELAAFRESKKELLFRFRGTDFELANNDPPDNEEPGADSEAAKSDRKPSCYKLDQESIFPALFDSKEAFDGVLLARRSGEVVYQHGVADLGVTRLGPLLAADKPKADKEKDKEAGAEETSSFSSAASYRNVELGGRDFKLFIQPINLPVGSSFAAGASETWLLCGLVAADRFVYKSLAISSSLLLLILTPLLLSLLAWPLLRLRLIGERQRVRVFDVLLLGMCTLFGVAILTLALLDIYAYAHLRSVSGDQLRDFAEKMADEISREIDLVRGHLADLQEQARRSPYEAEQEISEIRKMSLSESRFVLIDGKGLQKLRWGSRAYRRFLDVSDRDYFKKVRDGETWTSPGRVAGKELGPFFVQSVRSRTRNRREAVVAAPVVGELEERGYAVATLTLPIRSAIDPITPPGFEFAVIDDEGLVLFNSNSARNGVENFFTETDGDPRVRSAVFARLDEEMGIRYFGKDYMAVSEPVVGLPWTVMALRDEEQLRALNLEWVVITILFLILCSCPLAVVLLAIVVSRPGYRAPWLWPDPNRAGDYMNLAALLALYCVAFGVAITHLREVDELLGIAWTLPFFALLTGYARLHERMTTVRKIAVYTGYFLLSITMLWALFGDGSRGDGRSRLGNAAVIVALLILSTSLLSARHPARWRKWAEQFHLPVARAYPLAALLLVVLTTVLPTVGIFKAVHRLELDSFIRYGQLKLARALAEPLAPARGGDRTGRASDERGPTYLGYGSAFFQTERLTGEPEKCRCKHAMGRQPAHADADAPLPEFLEDLLPQHSVHSAEMRKLLHGRATDCSWDSHPPPKDAPEGTMILHLRGGRGPDVYLSSNPRQIAGTEQEIAMAGFFGGGSVGSRLAGALLSLGLIALLISLIFRLVLFISQRLFLVDIREPLWTVAGDMLAPITGRNLFLVRKSLISPVEAAAMGLKYLHLGEIDQAGDAGGEALVRRCRELVDSESDVLVVGFEHRIFDPAFNARKLALLENLMESRERSVIVLSQVSPTRLFSSEPVEASPAVTDGPPGVYERWRAVLRSFTLIEEDLRSRPAVSGASASSFWSELARPFLRWGKVIGATSESFIIKSPVLREESGKDPFLLKIAHGVDLGRHGMGREQLLEEFGERAEGYYSAVWESCSRDEKVVLQHLAQEGLVHEKNRRVVRRLMARGLIRRAPNFCLFNESFRRFACSQLARNQVLALEQSAGPSAWDRFRWPFLAVVSASIAFFFATQQQLLDSTLATVTGLTAGLPAVVKLIDLLGGKRSGAK
jgi:hypothetical protein